MCHAPVGVLALCSGSEGFMDAHPHPEGVTAVRPGPRGVIPCVPVLRVPWCCVLHCKVTCSSGCHGSESWS